MVEYALLTAGNALAPLRIAAERVMSSVGVADALLIAGGAWVLWRLLDRLLGPRTR